MVAVLMVDGKKMVVGSVKLPAAKGTDQPMNGMIPLPIVFSDVFCDSFTSLTTSSADLEKIAFSFTFFDKYAPFRRLYWP